MKGPRQGLWQWSLVIFLLFHLKATVKIRETMINSCAKSAIRSNDFFAVAKDFAESLSVTISWTSSSYPLSILLLLLILLCEHALGCCFWYEPSVPKRYPYRERELNYCDASKLPKPSLLIYHFSTIKHFNRQKSLAILILLKSFFYHNLINRFFVDLFDIQTSLSNIAQLFRCSSSINIDFRTYKNDDD